MYLGLFFTDETFNTGSFRCVTNVIAVINQMCEKGKG